MNLPEPITVRVLTLSDRASRGDYEDLSGPALTEAIVVYLQDRGLITEIDHMILPDDPGLLRQTIKQFVEEGIHLVFTTGGTGLGPRDITPDVVRPLLDKEIPGIMELIRVKYGMVKAQALVSRAIAGLIGQTLIYCLPGSVKAVKEYSAEILPTVIHSVKMVLGMDDHG